MSGLSEEDTEQVTFFSLFKYEALFQLLYLSEIPLKKNTNLSQSSQQGRTLHLSPDMIALALISHWMTYIQLLSCKVQK